MKPAKMFVVVLMVLCIAYTSIPITGVVEEQLTINLQYKFDAPIVSKKNGDSEVSVRGLEKVAVSIAELPIQHVEVLLPYNTTVDQYNVSFSQEKSISNIELPKPAEYFPISDDSVSLPAGDLQIDTHASIGSVMYMRGFAFFIIDLFPVIYSDNTLDYVQDINLSISLKSAGDEAPEYIPTIVDADLLPDDYSCPENLTTYFHSKPTLTINSSSLLGYGVYDYVIITKGIYVNDFKPLRSFKISKGLKAKIITVESINSYYKGRDLPEKIREFIKDAYIKNRLRFVLLGGDADANSANPKKISYKSVVPTRLLYCGQVSSSYKITYIASDLYYSCLDGNYDYNKNSIFGEKNDGIKGGQVDFLPDVFVGRAPVDSHTEVKNFVSKTIAYEKRSKSKTALMVGEKLDGSNACAAGLALNSLHSRDQEQNLITLYQLRDTKLSREIIDLYYDAQPALLSVISNDSSLLMDLAIYLTAYMKPLGTYLQGGTETFRIGAADVSNLANYVTRLRQALIKSNIEYANMDKLTSTLSNLIDYIKTCSGKTVGRAIGESPFSGDSSFKADIYSLADTWGMDYKEEIRKGSTKYSITTKGIPSSYKTSTLYDKTYANNKWPKSVLISKLNVSPEIVNHLGHGNNTTMMRLLISDLKSLKNAKSLFLFSQACYPGAFDNMNSDNKYTSTDSIGEQLIVNSARTGAVAAVLNSRFGWYRKESTQGPTQLFDRYFFHEFAKNPRTSLGVLLAKSKMDVLKLGYVTSESVLRFCYYTINLLGDPEMSLTTTKATLGTSYMLEDEYSLIIDLTDPSYLDSLSDPSLIPPKTGDTFPLVLLFILVSLSMTTLTVFALRYKSRKN